MNNLVAAGQQASKHPNPNLVLEGRENSLRTESRPVSVLLPPFLHHDLHSSLSLSRLRHITLQFSIETDTSRDARGTPVKNLTRGGSKPTTRGTNLQECALVYRGQNHRRQCVEGALHRISKSTIRILTSLNSYRRGTSRFGLYSDSEDESYHAYDSESDASSSTSSTPSSSEIQNTRQPTAFDELGSPLKRLKCVQIPGSPCHLLTQVLQT